MVTSVVGGWGGDVQGVGGKKETGSPFCFCEEVVPKRRRPEKAQLVDGGSWSSKLLPDALPEEIRRDRVRRGKHSKD